MKQFIKKLLFFIVFSLVVYSVLVCAWGDLAREIFAKNLNYKLGLHGYMHTRLQEIYDYENVDILFIGSSHAFRGFDTRIFREYGLTSFNLGSSSQSPLQSKILLDRYVDVVKPKMVIIEVYPYTFGMVGYESTLDLLANDRIDWVVIKLALTRKQLRISNTLIYAMYRKMFGLDDGFTEDRRKDDDTYIPGGYIQKDERYYSPEEFESADIGYRDEQFRAFEEMLKLLKRKGISVVLVQAPITSVHYNSFTNLDDFESRMSEAADYYNFNDILSLDDSLYFFDSNHLNQEGVELFNRELIDILQKEDWVR